MTSLAPVPTETKYLRQQVIFVMRLLHIRPASHNYHDYEIAKRGLDTLELTPAEYQEAVEIVARWVGV